MQPPLQCCLIHKLSKIWTEVKQKIEHKLGHNKLKEGRNKGYRKREDLTHAHARAHTHTHKGGHKKLRGSRNQRKVRECKTQRRS